VPYSGKKAEPAPKVAPAPPPAKHAVTALCFSADGKKVAAGCSDGKCRLWSVDGWKLIREIQIDDNQRKGVTKEVTCLAFFPCGKKIVAGDDEGIVNVIDVETGKLLASLRALRRTTWTVAVSPDGKYVGSSDLHRWFHVWDAENDQSIATLKLTLTYPCITFGKDKAILAAGKELRIFDVKTKKLTKPRELQ